MNNFMDFARAMKEHKLKVLTSILTLTSICFAHYAGFILYLPTQIVAAASSSLATGITLTFLSYVMICAVFARVIVGFFQTFLPPITLLITRFENGVNLKAMKRKIKYVESYDGVLKMDSIVWLFFQMMTFIFLLLVLYVDVNYSNRGLGLFLLVSLFMILSWALRSKLLLVGNINGFIRRIKRRQKFKANAISASLLTFATTLILVSFLMGKMRVNMLKEASPQQITNSYFIGYANLLASSGTASLLLERDGDYRRYIYATSEFVLTVESEPKHFPKLIKL